MTDPSTEAPAAPALKDWFDRACYERWAADVAAVWPAFDKKRFVKLALPGLEELSLMQRLRRTTECLRATLPEDYRRALRILRDVAPRIQHNFVSLVLPDFAGLYGLDDFDASMEALREFTVVGSSEFAIREFLRRDLKKTLKVMQGWSRHEHEAVRRLASEGCRPRLPWSFKLDALIADPSPALPILRNLKADPSLYVRKSVANHLNDITKDHPGRVLDELAAWPLETPETAWICKRALRTLIKQGDVRALELIGASGEAPVDVAGFSASPVRLQLGERLTLETRLHSTAAKPCRLVVDYAVHYVKKSGATSAKVFKWKELTLAPGDAVDLARSQVVKNFTTRTHHAGRHAVDLLVNGTVVASTAFDLHC